MASMKKGILSVTREWAQHLRKYGRRVFWKGERAAEKKEIKRQQVPE